MLSSDNTSQAGSNRSCGPQTPAGKARSRRNAVKHGLCANTLLAEVFRTRSSRTPSRKTAHRHPTSPTQEILVTELARHAAALETAERAEAAVLRFGMRGAITLRNADDNPENDLDMLLTGAVTTEAIERLTRYRRAHEKGWFAALLRLREAKAMERPEGMIAPPAPMAIFSSEGACEEYLIARARRADRHCPRCGWRRGYWLANRRRWQCAACSRQFGIRSGTVLEGSSLPLKTWLVAIQTILENRTISVQALATATGVRRLWTARRVALKIRRALDSQHATELLAGLDEIVRLRRGP